MRPEDCFDIVVIGAGIAGASLAGELAKTRSVALLEMEDQPGYHATGRSAAIFAQNYGPRQIRAITRASEPFFRAPAVNFAASPLFSPRAILRVARQDQLGSLDALHREMSQDCDMIWLDQSQLQDRVPLLRQGRITAGIINKAAQDIDVNGLHRGYLNQFQNLGGTSFCNAPVSQISYSADGWVIYAKQHTLCARIVVNAAGAWADEVAGLAGLKPLGLTPLRRTAITIDAPSAYDISDLPMVVDADDQFYLKPEGGRLLASPSDETPCQPCDSRPEEIDIAICVDRITKAFDLSVKRVKNSWAGLRTFAPDGLPICGFDSAAPSFFWLAGQGGYGVQTAPAMAQIASALITNTPMPENIVQAGIDPTELSPCRLLLAA